MLKELYIENLAVIERASIPFEAGLNVFTGETGAGKSVLIGGLNAALGKRVSKESVRTGAKKAVVTAVFDALPEGVLIELENLGVECDGELFLTREITTDGRSTARINNRPVAASSLSTLGAMLCDIHGQHDSVVLTDPAAHLKLLDTYGGYEDKLGSYRAKFLELNNVSRALQTAVKNAEEAKANIERHRTVRDDIESLHITPGEDEEIDFLFDKLQNAETVKAAAIAAARAVSSDDEDFEGALERLYAAEREILPFIKAYPALRTVADDLANAQTLLETLFPTLSSFADSLSADEEKLHFYRTRKDDIDRIKRLYGGTERSLTTALDVCAKSVAALKLISTSDEDIKTLKAKKQTLLTEVSALARELSALRKNTAEQMSQAIAAELRELDMAYVSVSFNLTSGKLTKDGLDTAEILFSPNPGEELRPLAKIASGGELSRVMLALKSVTAGQSAEPLVMVFDEIDTGVSGRAAAKIGRKLSKLAKAGGQAIAVTHLAQIAVCADRQLLIEKAVEGERTYTRVNVIEGEARIREIARIQVGDNITELALKNAEEQLAHFNKR
jgi:DNA repair protein RecN (Recombination protein N)